jgi:Lrp/AsnC family transcriptional regulator, leucine-responsive regulatory protein
MDDKDKKLIAILKCDARRPIVALARDIDLSRSATQERLARLTKSGAVSYFTIVEGKTDVDEQAAHFLLKLEKGKTCALVVPKLKMLPYVFAIHSVAGLYDLVMRVNAPSIAEIEKTRAAISSVSGIGEVTTLIALERHLG